MVEASSGRRVCFVRSFLLPVSLARRWPPRFETFREKFSTAPESSIHPTSSTPSYSLRPRGCLVRRRELSRCESDLKLSPYICSSFSPSFPSSGVVNPCRGFGIGPRRLVPPLFPRYHERSILRNDVWSLSVLFFEQKPFLYFILSCEFILRSNDISGIVTRQRYLRCICLESASICNKFARSQFLITSIYVTARPISNNFDIRISRANTIQKMIYL